MKIVSPQNGRYGDSSGTETDPLLGGGRRVARCSIPVCEQGSVFSVWKSTDVSICFLSNGNFVFPYGFRTRSFPDVS